MDRDWTEQDEVYRESVRDWLDERDAVDDRDAIRREVMAEDDDEPRRPRNLRWP